MQAHTANDYAHQLRALIPPGKAWQIESGDVFDLDLEGEAEELARIDARAVYLVLKEFFAQSTRELLPDWEEEYGLPDECTTLGVTYDERIENLLRKIRTIGGQSIAYLVSVAAALGIEITIDEFRPFRVGRNRCGDRLYSREWMFVFRVNAPSAKMYRFRVGRNSVGDRFRYWRRNEILECIINKIKPAHTFPIYAYFDAGILVTAFVFRDEAGNAVLRDEIEREANDPILNLDADGDVSVTGSLESGAENAAMRVGNDGSIFIKG